MDKQELKEQRSIFNEWYKDMAAEQRREGAPVPSRAEMWEFFIAHVMSDRDQDKDN